MNRAIYNFMLFVSSVELGILLGVILLILGGII